jgi:hypothetical protein
MGPLPTTRGRHSSRGPARAKAHCLEQVSAPVWIHHDPDEQWRPGLVVPNGIAKRVIDLHGDRLLRSRGGDTDNRSTGGLRAGLVDLHDGPMLMALMKALQSTPVLGNTTIMLMRPL